jgi:hypothetical protein
MEELGAGASGIPYEAPRLTVIGSIAELTLGTDKKYGDSDGFTFMGQPITFSSA